METKKNGGDGGLCACTPVACGADGGTDRVCGFMTVSTAGRCWSFIILVIVMSYSFSQLQTRLLNTTMLAFYRGFISSQITKHETSQGHRKKVSY